jgi:hypothetical protein
VNHSSPTFKIFVDAESFATITRTRPHVPETGPRASVLGVGGWISWAGSLTIGEQGLVV